MLSTNTIERFGGIARLYGERALKNFTESHVCVIGIGGVGSWSVEALARSGVGKITMVDLDDVCITNVNRQLHALDGQVGRQKTDAMADRIRAINPECEVTCVQKFYSERNADQILSEDFDFVIDAIDLSRAKAHLVSSCVKSGIPIIVCGGVGGLTDPSQIKIEDLARIHNDGLLKSVRDDLRNHYNFPRGRDKGKSKKFGVESIFSTESPVFPKCDGSVSDQKPTAQSMQLNCSSGYGSITHMTATLAFFATERCLKKLAQPKHELV